MLKHLQAREDWAEKSLGAKGFTLIELLVVIVILGVLGAVVVFSVRGVTDKGKNSACLTEKRTIATAVEAYNAQLGGYPDSGDLDILESKGFLQDKTTPATGYTWTANGKVSQTAPCPK